MAVNSIPLSSAMVVSFQTGISPTGVPVIRKKTLANVRFDASEQDVYDVAHALFSLTEHPAMKVILQQNLELVDDE